MPDEMLPFLGVIVVVTLTPGPDMVLVLRNGLAGGSDVAWKTGLGCCTGIAIYGLAATLGLAAVFETSPGTFETVKTLGAVYLVYLGARAVVSTLRRRSTDHNQAGQPAAEERSLTSGEAFRQGLVSNLLNPKIALLFLTLIPQFVGPDEPAARTSAILALTFLAMGMAWMRVFSLAVAFLGGLLMARRFREWAERFAGGVLVGLGVLLLAK